MSPANVLLPDLDALDIERLKALVVEKHALVIEKEGELASQQDEIQRLKLFIAKWILSVEDDTSEFWRDDQQR